MSGFKELAGIKLIDSLIVTDQYGGVNYNLEGKELFIIFRVKDVDEKDEEKYKIIAKETLVEAFSKEYIFINKYLGDGKFTVSATEGNPNKKEFVFKAFYTYDKSFYHVLVLSRGELTGHHAISVSVKMDEENFETTSFIAQQKHRLIPPSYVVF